MSKARMLLDLMKEQKGAGGGGFTGGGSIASLGKIPSPALGVVSEPGTSYELDVPTIPKRRKKKKKQRREAVSDLNSRRKLYHKRRGERGKTYDIDIGLGKNTISGAYGTPR